jgi:hypothetical protein
MDIKEQLHQLDQTLLSVVSTEFASPPLEEDRVLIRAYLVLAHAILEEQLEELFRVHVKVLADALVGPTVPVECVRLALALGQATKPSGDYESRDSIRCIKQGGVKEMQRQTDQNHGIKTKNIQSLAETAGCDWPALDAQLNGCLADLDTLGVKRGFAGHHSPYAGRTTDIVDNDTSDDVRQWVENGRLAVEAIGQYLEALRTQSSSQFSAGEDPSREDDPEGVVGTTTKPGES